MEVKLLTQPEPYIVAGALVNKVATYASARHVLMSSTHIG